MTKRKPGPFVRSIDRYGYHLDGDGLWWFFNCQTGWHRVRVTCPAFRFYRQLDLATRLGGRAAAARFEDRFRAIQAERKAMAPINSTWRH